MQLRGFLHPRWLAGVLLLAGASAADAQPIPPPKTNTAPRATGTSSGVIQPLAPTAPNTAVSGPTTGRQCPTGTTGTGQTTADGTGAGGGGGFGSFFGLLTPDQELLVLLDTLDTVDALLSSGAVDVTNEIQIIFLLMIVYEIKYQEAVAALLGGTDPGTGTTPGTGGAIPTTPAAPTPTPGG